jgi:PAS domain S-box-containing protein
MTTATQITEIEVLRRELREAQETLRAIAEGEVDAFVTRRSGLYRVQALVDADTPYRILVESMRDIALTVSEAGVVLYCNRPFAQAVGVDQAEIIGESAAVWLELGPALDEVLARAACGEVRCDGQLRVTSGSLPVAVTACALPADAGASVFCLLLTDLTDRVAAEQLRAEQVLLARQRGELAAICKCLPFALLLAEAPELISYVNPAADTLLARHSWLRPHAAEAAGRVLAGASFEAYEATFAPGGGPEVAFRIHAMPLAVEGWPLRVLVVIQDFSAERQMRLTRERQEQFRETFVGILGHDLRTPLMAVSAAASMLRLTSAPAEIDALAGTLERASRRMKRLIQDMLDLTLSRIGGGIPVKLSKLDLEEAVRGAIDELRVTFGQSFFHVDVRGNPEGEWDGSRLNQVITNLLTNAAEHGTSGRPVRILIDGVSPAWVLLSVTNEGQPIPSELLPEIFDPFRRDQSRSQRTGSGLGLGLYIAERIVSAHLGTIWVDSTARETTFTVRLPRRVESQR